MGGLDRAVAHHRHGAFDQIGRFGGPVAHESLPDLPTDFSAALPARQRTWRDRMRPLRSAHRFDVDDGATGVFDLDGVLAAAGEHEDDHGLAGQDGVARNTRVSPVAIPGGRTPAPAPVPESPATAFGFAKASLPRVASRLGADAVAGANVRFPVWAEFAANVDEPFADGAA